MNVCSNILIDTNRRARNRQSE